MAIPTLTISIRDAKGKVSKMRLYLDDTSYGDISGNYLWDMEEYVKEVIRRLNPIITGAIVGCDVSLSIDLPAGIRAIPLSTSDVEEGALFAFPGNGNGEGSFSGTVPTFNHSLFPPGGSQMSDDFNADVSSYSTLLWLPTESLGWADEYGGITDNRGVRATREPIIYKRFRNR